MPVFQLEKEPIFPLPHLAEDSGLLAVGGDLSVERLIQAYAHGIFPWYSEGDPILWWSPNPRMVLFPNQFNVSRSLRKAIETGGFTVSFDSHFGEVIRACARVPRKGEKGTWITEEMIEAYTNLYDAGYAHSVEIFEHGELAGGLYGVSLGSAFFGESMFYRQRDASKVALYFLVERLKDWNFSFIDTQVETDHLKRLGAVNIPRAEFLDLLKEALSSKTIAEKW